VDRARELGQRVRMRQMSAPLSHADAGSERIADRDVDDQRHAMAMRDPASAFRGCPDVATRIARAHGLGEPRTLGVLSRSAASMLHTRLSPVGKAGGEPGAASTLGHEQRCALRAHNAWERG